MAGAFSSWLPRELDLAELERRPLPTRAARGTGKSSGVIVAASICARRPWMVRMRLRRHGAAACPAHQFLLEEVDLVRISLNQSS
jgi:hypothetical protein